MLSKRSRRARTIATVLLSTLVFLASNVVAEAAPVDSSPVGESSDADRAADAMPDNRSADGRGSRE